MRKNKSKVCFVESSFGQKVRSTFPLAQYRIASPFQNDANVVCLRKTNTNSRAHIKTRGSQEPVIDHLVFNLTSKVDRKWGCYT